ncbi:hypothetical protein IV500_02660 [Paeniglutamicibacter antarcticus]|uniref:Uncharacterized protein n=1 Tax=Arthrobacter terrae TaxID=2935737 RepID=A0A931CJV4_9MICC|nr:hypothetical protein [Arthrobacter terrae]MBG0738332.1 hypothetical protein [Arthrobacter terrae]
MNPGKHSAVPGTSRTRVLARWARKRAKRLRSCVSWIDLSIRNVTATSSVLGQTPAVVSLTTYGERINAAAIAVESIARGKSKPRRMILWLDNEAVYDARPMALRRLERRGLEVRLTENLGPHTKYFPYVESVEHHELPLVTADDDIIYPRYWLRNLYEAFQAHPLNVNCHWASTLKTEGIQLATYRTWPNCMKSAAEFGHFGLGVSGVIYPPGLLEELKTRGKRFQVMSPTADDVWLHWVALRSGFPVRQISPVPRHFPLIPGTQRKTLMQTNNVEGSGNDAWIRGLYTVDDVVRVASRSDSRGLVAVDETSNRLSDGPSRVEQGI